MSKDRDLRELRERQHRVKQDSQDLQGTLVELVLKGHKVPQELKDFPVHRRVVLNYQHRLIVIVTVLA